MECGLAVRCGPQELAIATETELKFYGPDGKLLRTTPNGQTCIPYCEPPTSARDTIPR